MKISDKTAIKIVTITIITTAIISLLSLGAIIGIATTTKDIKQVTADNQTLLTHLTIEEENLFNTSALETWCMGEDIGTIRMVGAWYVAEETIQDDTGMLWNVKGATETDFFLLWIANNNTDTMTDDVIVKMWKESY